MFNKHDIARDACQLFGAQARKAFILELSDSAEAFVADLTSRIVHRLTVLYQP